MNLRTISVDHIASSTAPCDLQGDIQLSDYIVAQEGYCVAVRALDEKPHYNQIEHADGSFHTLHKADVIVGALGERQALKGYSGRIPRRIGVGDTLHILNMGGIVGLCTSDHPDLGPALRVEVLGAVMAGRAGNPVHARLQDHAIEPIYRLQESAPLVLVSGTAMNTGKTYAAAQIVKGLTQRGYRVAAAKCTGAALKRDVRVMQESGAVACATFTDAGAVSSTNKEMAPIAKGLITHLNAAGPDVLVVELGDGFIGYYGVDELLLDKEIQRHTVAHVVAAADLAGAWAADQIFRSRYLTSILSLTGPVTDNAVGKQYIRNVLGIDAHNALQDGEALCGLIADALIAGPAALQSSYAAQIAATG